MPDSREELKAWIRELLVDNPDSAYAHATALVDLLYPKYGNQAQDFFVEIVTRAWNTRMGKQP